MGMTKIISIVTLFLMVTNVSAPSILKNYFKRNKDSLFIEANKGINIAKPTFKRSQPVNFNADFLKDKGFEQIYKTGNHYFRTNDRKKKLAYYFPINSNYPIIPIRGGIQQVSLTRTDSINPFLQIHIARIIRLKV